MNEERKSLGQRLRGFIGRFFYADRKQYGISPDFAFGENISPEEWLSTLAKLSPNTVSVMRSIVNHTIRQTPEQNFSSISDIG